MVSSSWLCIFLDVSVSVFCLKVFNVISLRRAFGEKSIVQLSIMMLLP